MGCSPVSKLTRLRRALPCASAPIFWLAGFYLMAFWVSASASPLQISGNLAFLPDQTGQLKIVRLADSTNTTLLSTVPDLSDISGIALHEQYAFVSVLHEGLFIYDLSTPQVTLLSGRFRSIGSAEDVKVSGTTAFLADGEYAIVVIDLFNPNEPLELPSVFPPGIAYSLDVAGPRLYAACGDGGLRIYDIAKVSEVDGLGHRDTASPAHRVRVAGHHAYVLCEGGRLEIINIQNPELPALMATYLTNGYLADVDVKGTVAVLANTNGVLTVLNVSNPAAPVVQSTHQIAGGAWGVRFNGANAYVRNGAGNLVVIPVAGLAASAPQLQEGVAAKVVALGDSVVLSAMVSGTTPLTYQWSRNGVLLTNDVRFSGTTNAWLVISNTAITDTGVYAVAISNALGALVSSNVLTVVNPGAPVWRGAFDPGGSAESVDVNDATVYVAAGANGLEVYNTINPRYPWSLIGNYVEGFATGIRVTPGYAFVAAAVNGLQVFNTLGQLGSEMIGATNTPGTARAVYLAGGLAYVADGESGLAIYHLSDTEQPAFVGGYDTPGYAWNVFVADGRAYVADGTNGVMIFSVTNPAAISWLGAYDTPGEARNVKVFADRAYIADGPNGLIVVDVANPGAPSLLGSYPAGAPALDLELAGDIVVLARGTNGVESVNIANPAAIVSLGTQLVTPAKSLRLEGNYVYVAAGTNGVQILELLGLTVEYPEITAIPPEVITLPGAVVTFQATASGMAPLTYQWYKNGELLFDNATTFGAGTATLTRSNLALADTDEYFVIVRNAWNLTESARVNLIVVPVGTPVFRAGHYDEGDSLNTHVVGQIAFVASRLNGLQAIDCRNPLTPVLVGQHPTLGLAQDVRVKGRYAYVASWSAGLEIFDVINPTNLVRVGHCLTPGFARAVQITDQFAHVADRNGGYSIIDIRDPARPAVVGTAATGGFAEGLAVSGSHAYVAASAAGMEIYDTGNPLAPTRIAQLNTPGNAESVTLSGNRAYISDYHQGVGIVDVNNPQLPVALGQFQTAGDAFHVQVIGNHAYIAGGIGKVEMVDISNASQPTHISTSLAGNSVHGMQIIGQHAFIADREAGLVVAELLGLPPSAPSIVEISLSVTNVVGRELVLSVATEGTPPLSFAWYRNGIPLTNTASVTGANQPHLRFPALASTNAGNYTAVVSSPYGSITSAVATVTVNAYGAPMARGLIDTPGSATAAVMQGTVAFIADGASGLRFVDLSNPNISGSLALTGSVFGLCLQTNLLFVALGLNGVAILDVSQPTQPIYVGGFDTPGTALNLDVSNARAYVADGAGGLRIFDVAQPGSPAFLGFLATTDSTRDVRVNGNLAYVADGAGGTRIVNVSNPGAPGVIGSYPTTRTANAIRLANNRAYVACGNEGLVILDVQNSALPVALGAYPTANASGLDIIGHLVVLADGANGYLILDATNPGAVTLVGSAPSPAANGAQVLGNLALLSSGAQGLRLVELSGVNALAPTFLEQPTNTAALAGGVAQFNATPSGTPPLAYRWYHNGLPVFDGPRIFGAATTRLTVSEVGFTDGGSYQLRVLGPAGVSNSALAQLNFIGPLQAQLNAATNGATINLSPGTYLETLVLDRDLTLTGPWWDKPVLSGGSIGPALRVLPGATVMLRGIALRHGHNAGLGGGIVNEGTLLLERCLIADNSAASGGGIANLNTLHLFQSVLSNNIASASGGGLYNGPAAVAYITNSTFTANVAEAGAGLVNFGTNTLSASLLTDNSAQGLLGNGGGINQGSGQMLLINSTVSGNTATAYTSQAGSGLGGGVRVDGGRLDLLFTTVVNNTASFRGGGVLASPAAEVHARNSIFARNLAPNFPDFRGILYSAGYNLVEQTAGLSVSGLTIGNQLGVNPKLGSLRDNAGPTFTHAPLADSPVIDAGAAPGPTTDARGVPRPFDIPWTANADAAYDLGAMEYVDRSPYLVVSNRTTAGFTLVWATNAVLQKAAFPDAIWLDQTNHSPLFVATTNEPHFFRLRAPVLPVVLTTNNETTNGFDLSWPDFGVLESAPTPDGPWESQTGLSPAQITIQSGQNEFFRLRVIED